MCSRRFIALLLIAAAGLAAIVALAAGVGSDATRPRAAAPEGVPAATPKAAAASASATAAPAATSAGPVATTPQTASVAAPATGAGVLDAVRALKRFCDLVDEGRRRAAARLLSGPWVWPPRELERFTRLRFVSARVQPGAVADDVVLLTRVRLAVRGPSPLHDGVNTLFFTLGRDGTTGGWLITAVTTSP